MPKSTSPKDLTTKRPSPPPPKPKGPQDLTAEVKPPKKGPPQSTPRGKPPAG